MNRRQTLTVQRQVILDLVKQASDHPTATDIMDRLRQHGYRFAYGTVYNSLHYLAQAGFISELQLGQGTARYDGRLEDHLHVVCRTCGRVAEYEAALPELWARTVEKETGFDLRDARLVIEALCADCKNPESPRA